MSENDILVYLAIIIAVLALILSVVAYKVSNIAINISCERRHITRPRTKQKRRFIQPARPTKDTSIVLQEEPNKIAPITAPQDIAPSLQSPPRVKGGFGTKES